MLRAILIFAAIFVFDVVVACALAYIVLQFVLAALGK